MNPDKIFGNLRSPNRSLPEKIDLLDQLLQQSPHRFKEIIENLRVNLINQETRTRIHTVIPTTPSILNLLQNLKEILNLHQHPISIDTKTLLELHQTNPDIFSIHGNPENNKIQQLRITDARNLFTEDFQIKPEFFDIIEILQNSITHLELQNIIPNQYEISNPQRDPNIIRENLRFEHIEEFLSGFNHLTSLCLETTDPNFREYRDLQSPDTFLTPILQLPNLHQLTHLHLENKNRLIIEGEAFTHNLDNLTHLTLNSPEGYICEYDEVNQPYPSASYVWPASLITFSTNNTQPISHPDNPQTPNRHDTLFLATIKPYEVNQNIHTIKIHTEDNIPQQIINSIAPAIQEDDLPINISTPTTQETILELKIYNHYQIVSPEGTTTIQQEQPLNINSIPETELQQRNFRHLTRRRVAIQSINLNTLNLPLLIQTNKTDQILQAITEKTTINFSFQPDDPETHNHYETNHAHEETIPFLVECFSPNFNLRIELPFSETIALATALKDYIQEDYEELAPEISTRFFSSTEDFDQLHEITPFKLNLGNMLILEIPSQSRHTDNQEINVITNRNKNFIEWLNTTNQVEFTENDMDPYELSIEDDGSVDEHLDPNLLIIFMAKHQNFLNQTKEIIFNGTYLPTPDLEELKTNSQINQIQFDYCEINEEEDLTQLAKLLNTPFLSNVKRLIINDCEFNQEEVETTLQRPDINIIVN